MQTRRSFLRTATGATLSLPFLESLHGAVARPAQRLAVFYVPIGVVRRNFYPGEQEVGLVNFTDHLHGVQIGLWNQVNSRPWGKNDPLPRVFPIINIGH